MSSGVVRTYHKDFCNPWDCTKDCNEINGIQLNEEYFQNNGKKEGIYRCYYSNGQIYNECNYIDGKISGILKFFNDAGKVTEEQIYTDGVLEKYITYAYYVDGGLAEVKEKIINGKN